MIQAKVSFRWNGPRVAKANVAALMAGIQAGAEYLARQIESNISIIGPPASEPGEFPHVDTGELQDRIEVQRGRGYSVRVVATAEHAEYVEKSRPFIRRTYLEERKRLRHVIMSRARASVGHTKLE